MINSKASKIPSKLSVNLFRTFKTISAKYPEYLPPPKNAKRVYTKNNKRNQREITARLNFYYWNQTDLKADEIGFFLAYTPLPPQTQVFEYIELNIQIHKCSSI